MTIIRGMYRFYTVLVSDQDCVLKLVLKISVFPLIWHAFCLEGKRFAHGKTFLRRQLVLFKEALFPINTLNGLMVSSVCVLIDY